MLNIFQDKFFQQINTKTLENNILQKLVQHQKIKNRFKNINVKNVLQEKNKEHVKTYHPSHQQQILRKAAAIQVDHRMIKMLMLLE